MEKRIPNFAEFSAVKCTKTQKIIPEVVEIKESQESFNNSINEGFLDSILRFFKGIFDLFNDKTVKKEVEDSAEYFKEIQEDETISDEEISDEIDTSRVRKTSNRIVVAIKKRIETDVEKKNKTSKLLTEKLASWFGQIIAYQDSLKMPLIKKMLSNSELSKKFTWVPSKYTEEGSKLKVIDWYKDKDCILDDTKVKPAIKMLVETSPDQIEQAVKSFSTAYIKFVVEKEDENELFAKGDPDFIEKIYLGFAAMATSVVSTMQGIINNTTDDKLNGVIADEIITARKRKGNKKSTKEVKKPDEEATSSIRARKNKKSTT